MSSCAIPAGRCPRSGSSTTNDTPRRDAAGALFLVPILGAIAGASEHSACSVPIYADYIGARFRTNESRGASGEAGCAIVAAFSTALQLAGGIMALVALAVPRAVPVFDAPSIGRVSIMPHASASAFGVDLSIGWM